VTDDNIVQCRKDVITCQVTKECRHALIICNMYFFVVATVVMQTCVSVTLYIHCLWCLKNIFSKLQGTSVVLRSRIFKRFFPLLNS
jgi:hypothetical protein